MGSDFEIGRVVAVDTAQVTIELNPDLKALTRSTYEGAYEIGRINSYVVLPVGARRLVAMVTRVVLAEEAEVTADRTMVTLPAARRLMKATLIGTIDGLDYTQGITIFPVLDSPVHMVTEAELAVIFDHRKEDDLPKPEDPGFCIRIGESPIFAGYPIKINPDAFFGKHAAIIGSTGSGKSCTIASLIQSTLSRNEVRHTHIVILDTNGEYQEALPEAEYSTLCIPSDPNKRVERLVIPYWFMNGDDLVRIFKAAPTTQRPILLDAIRRAREVTSPGPAWRTLRNDLIGELNRILGHSRGTDKTDAKAIRRLANGLEQYLSDPAHGDALTEIATLYPTVTKQRILEVAKRIADIAREGISNEGGQYESYAVIDVSKRHRIEAEAQPLLGALAEVQPTATELEGVATADTPVWFNKNEFRDSFLAQAMDREESGRAREHCSTMLLRIHRLFEDRRFEFLFGPVDGQWPKHEHALATFLRDLLGLATADSPYPDFSGEAAVPTQSLPYYDRQRANGAPHKVVIVDLSLLAAEVLENVTALIGRLILEFLQRLGRPEERRRGDRYRLSLFWRRLKTISASGASGMRSPSPGKCSSGSPAKGASMASALSSHRSVRANSQRPCFPNAIVLSSTDFRTRRIFATSKRLSPASMARSSTNCLH